MSTELDQKVLNKNLEITKLSQQVDRLTSELVDLKEKQSSSQFKDLLIQENIDLKAEVSRLKDVIKQLYDPFR
jgi:regulator of replication initiation timing